MGTLVKICGVRSPEIARVVAAVRADLMGLIFAPSRRTVTAEEARRVASAARGNAEHVPMVVGVFVNETAERMNAIAAEVGLDAIQLSGDEPPEMLAHLDAPTIKVLRLPSGTALDQARREAERYFDRAHPVRALMLDTHVPGSYGGNGVTGDWDLAAELAAHYPVILAGGLKAENVAAAVQQIGPLGVDVSSGVETDGVKDADKIRRFVSIVRNVAASPAPLRAADLVSNPNIRFGAHSGAHRSS